MILFRNFRERLRLLEYENEILTKRLKALESPGKIKPPIIRPHARIIREDGWDLSYDTLRKRHRKHSVKYIYD